MPFPGPGRPVSECLTRFVNLLTASHAPPSVTSHLCGASLLACRKKHGGHRPIAVGEVLRRLVSKCLATHTRQLALSTSLQLGVSIQGEV